MAVLDGPMGQVAASLLGTFGRAATLRRAPSNEIEYTGIESEGAATTYPCSVVFEEFNESRIDGSTVQQGDRKAIVARSTLTVQPNPTTDVLIEGGRTWRIVGVTGYSSGSQEAAYALHVRR